MDEDYNIELESIEINYNIVIFLPIGLFLIFLIILIIALIKSNEPLGNILRIIFYIIAQFLFLPFLVLFILINSILLSISILFCKEVKYISFKKISNAFECLKCQCEKKVDVIKIQKKNVENININNDTNTNNLKINLQKNVINNNRDIIIEEKKEEKKEYEIKEEQKENLDLPNFNNNLNNKKENNFEEIHQSDKKFNSNNPKVENKNNIINKIDDSKEELKEDKVKISLNFNPDSNSNSKNINQNKRNYNYNFNKPPLNRKVDKGKIMNFLGEILVNKDNTPSYINFLQSIKQKSK